VIVSGRSSNRARPDRHLPAGVRVLSFFAGSGLAALAVVLVYQFGAGVVQSPTAGFYSPPTTLSLAELWLLIGLLAAGAAIAARPGLNYGTARGSESSTESRWLDRNVGQLAVFLGIFGVGLLLMGLSLPVYSASQLCSLPCYMSPSVFFVPQTLDAAGLGALVLGGAFFAVERHRHRAEFRAWWHRTGRYVTIAGVSVSLVVAGLLVVPVRYSESTRIGSGSAADGAAFLIFPAGVTVTGSWSIDPVGPVNFTVQCPTTVTIYEGNASSGNFSCTIPPGAPWSEALFLMTSKGPESGVVNISYYAPTWLWPYGEPTATAFNG
jgi:hypothetical protein